MTWIKKNSTITYLDFIRCVEALLFAVPVNIPSDKKGFFVRHDVDYDIGQAMRMAEYECEHCIHSTYFLLHTAPYFDYSDTFGDKIKRLIDYGHSVGFHNDVLSEWWDNRNCVLVEKLERPVLFLSKYTTVIGTSAHGKREHYERKYINYQLWSQYKHDLNDGFMLNWPQISLKTMGFLYEAYFLPYTHYFSDSGGNSIGYVVNGRKPFERRALEMAENIGVKVINEFNRAETGLLQLLIHPEHWEEKV